MSDDDLIILDEHPLQYAFVEGLTYPHTPVVYGTEQLTDDEVLNKLRDRWPRDDPYVQRKLQYRKAYRTRVVRFNRCPT